MSITCKWGLSNTELLQLVGQLIETSAKIGTVGK